jgi:hypothetical protein
MQYIEQQMLESNNVAMLESNNVAILESNNVTMVRSIDCREQQMLESNNVAITRNRSRSLCLSLTFYPTNLTLVKTRRKSQFSKTNTSQNNKQKKWN